jgi:hypothetical protein
MSVAATGWADARGPDPLQKPEAWLRLVPGETTYAETADRYGVDARPNTDLC